LLNNYEAAEIINESTTVIDLLKEEPYEDLFSIFLGQTKRKTMRHKFFLTFARTFFPVAEHAYLF